MGFLPSTKGQDGDPLDVLVLMDEPVFPGCFVGARLIGVVEAEQTERDGRTMRIDRLIAAAAVAHSHGSIQSLDQLEDSTVAEIEHFFASYNQIAGKEFNPAGRGGPDRARALADEGAKRGGSSAPAAG